MIQSVNQNILLPCSFNPGTIFQVPKNIQNYPGSDFSLYLQVLNPMCPNLQNILLQCAGQESKLLTPINWCQDSLPPHTQDAGDWVALLSPHTFRPPSSCIVTLHWVSVLLALHIYNEHYSKLTYWVLPPPSSAKCSKLYRGIVPALWGHCVGLIDLLTSVTQDTAPRWAHSTMHYALAVCIMCCIHTVHYDLVNAYHALCFILCAMHCRPCAVGYAL